MATETEKLMRDFIEAANSQDYERLASYLTDDSEYEDVPSGTVWHGAKQFIDYARSTVHIEFPDHRWEVISSFSDGQKVATEGLWTGTFTRSGDPNRPPTGKRVSIRMVSITEWRDGKVHRHRDYYDLLSFWRQLGVSMS